MGTTLRLTRSNEVCTVNNGDIASTRIVNYSRSKDALVNISLPVSYSATKHEHMVILKATLKQYILDNPRIWAKLVDWRLTTMDINEDIIVITVRVKHQMSWQDVLTVMAARGNMEKFCLDTILRLGIQYETPPSQYARDLYLKAVPDRFLFPEHQEPQSLSEDEQGDKS